MPARRRARRRPGRLDQDIPVAGLPVVAIVGRPNVGKSTLFNRIVGQRKAIVEDRARTTRDRLYGVAEWNDRRFVVVDTGGMEVDPGDDIEARVQDQARLAIGEADLIVLVVDAAVGETPGDLEAAEVLRHAAAPVIVAINKADNERLEQQGVEFLRLGWDEAHAVSALHGRGTGDLLDAIVEALPERSPDEAARLGRVDAAEELADRVAAVVAGEADLPAEDVEALELAAAGDGAVATDGSEAPDASDASSLEPAPEADDDADEPIPRIAIVGRPNVGKSSLLNKLLGEERAIVSEVAGTTRDAIDTSLEWQGRAVRLVDTAGLRRRGKVAAGPAAERYSALRALKAIGRADVCVLVLDARDGLAAQDAHVAGYVTDEGVGLVIAINKWDLVEKDGRTFEETVARIRGEAPFLHFAPVVAISALTGQRAGRILDEALKVARMRRRRVPTGALNRVLADAVARHQPPIVKNRRPRFYYATQAAIEPPTFVLFASEAASVHFSYQRFIENRLREAFDFAGTPLRLIFRERERVRLEKRRSRGSRRGGGSKRGAAGGGTGGTRAGAAKGRASAGGVAKRGAKKPGRKGT